MVTAVHATDTEKSSKKVGIGSNPAKNLKRTVAGEEVAMETLDVEEDDDSGVNISVSHMGLADNLRPLVGTKSNIQTQI